jgi:hypothetical protein
MSDLEFSRRPIKARDTHWAAAIASWLTRAGIRPNFISVFSAVFAAAAGGCLAATPYCEAAGASRITALSSRGTAASLPP